MTVRLWEGGGGGGGAGNVVFIRYVSKDSELRNYDSAFKPVYNFNRIEAKRSVFQCVHIICSA